MRKIIYGKCIECQLEKVLHARKCCANCYRKVLRRENPAERRPGRPKTDHSNTECLVCHKKGEYHAKGLCKSCYHAAKFKDLSPEQLEKHRLAASEWNKNNKERHRKNKFVWSLKTSYGMTMEDYAALLAKQDNKCTICHKVFENTKVTHIDHDHATNKVRSILCHGCNTGLGAFRDSPDLLETAAKYLRSFKEVIQ